MQAFEMRRKIKKEESMRGSLDTIKAIQEVFSVSGGLGADSGVSLFEVTDPDTATLVASGCVCSKKGDDYRLSESAFDDDGDLHLILRTEKRQKETERHARIAKRMKDASIEARQGLREKRHREDEEKEDRVSRTRLFDDVEK
jgi:hypothetical protein